MLDVSNSLLSTYTIIKIVGILIGSLFVVSIFNRFIHLAEDRTKLKRGQLIHARRFFQIIVYSLSIVLIMLVLEVNVTGIVAGLGVGALVIGFGLREIIENWVSGILIISGKTYRIDDIIMVENLKGLVTDISLRTTKLRTYDNNEIIIPNSMMLKQKIINFTGGASEATVSLNFTVDYISDVDKTKKVIEEVITSADGVIIDKERRRGIVHVVRVRDWTLEFETLFWTNDPENEEFIKSNISEKLKKRLTEENILPPIPSIIRRNYLPQRTVLISKMEEKQS